MTAGRKIRSNEIPPSKGSFQRFGLRYISGILDDDGQRSYSRLFHRAIDHLLFA